MESLHSARKHCAPTQNSRIETWRELTHEEGPLLAQPAQSIPFLTGNNNADSCGVLARKRNKERNYLVIVRDSE